MREIIDLTKELMRFKTVPSKPHEIERCTVFIENYLRTCGVVSRRFEYEKTPSILVLPQKGYTPVLLMSHIDVVDAPAELFRPMEKNNKIYGRGSLDDKYAVALSLVLLKKHMLRLRKQDRRSNDLPFGVLITADEESGGFKGAKKVLGEIKTDFCIVLDGGNVEKIVVKEKGIATIKLMSRGKAAPGDRPWLGENAMEKLIDDFQKLRVYFVKSAPAHPDRAVVIKRIQAGNLQDQIPEYAEAWLEIRYTGKDDMERLFDSMQKELHSKIVIENVEPLFEGGESLHLKLLSDISGKARVGFEDGANDARFLAQFGIKGIIWGANGGGSRHTADEHVDIDSVYELYGILDRFIMVL